MPASVKTTNERGGLPSLVEVRMAIKAELPPEAFQASTRLIISPLVHAAIFFVCAVSSQHQSGWVIVGLALIAGHSIFCVGNVAHYLSHRIIFRSRYVTYFFEYVLWAIAITPATVWVKIHNSTHHRNTNGKNDTFRYFTQDEKTPVRSLVHLLIFPNRYLKYNPLSLFAYFLILFAHVLGGMFPLKARSSSVVPTIPYYSTKERVLVWIELMGILAIQAGIFYLLDGGWKAYLLFVGVTYSVAIAITSLYIFSQHSLLPLEDDNHPFRSSMSVKVHPAVDWLHANVSYHVEHHLFEAMNYKFYPAVARIIKERYPTYYHCQPLGAVWVKMQENYLYKQSPSVEWMRSNNHRECVK